MKRRAGRGNGWASLARRAMELSIRLGAAGLTFALAAGCGSGGGGNTGSGSEGTRWGVWNQICCPSNTSTLEVTIDGVTRRSSSPPSCEPQEATFEGYVSTTPGTKTMTGRLLGGVCGDFDFSGPVTFQKNKCFLVISNLVDGDPAVGATLVPGCGEPNATALTFRPSAGERMRASGVSGG